MSEAEWKHSYEDGARRWYRNSDFFRYVLPEIEEYALKLKEGKTCDDSEGTANSYLDDSHSEINYLYQEVEIVKQELEEEKVMNLEEIINRKKKIVVSLESKDKGRKTDKRLKRN